MADRNFLVELTLQAKDNISNSLRDLSSKIEQNKKSMEEMGKIFAVTGAAITGVLGLTVKAAAEQEEANILLAESMKNVKTFTDANYKANLDYASSMQLLTKFSDDQIIAAETILIDYGIQQDKLHEVTKATMDLAEAKKMDLVSAANLVARSIGTESSALGRYGIDMKDAYTITERTDKMLLGISNTFENKSTNAAKTFSGQLIVTARQIDELAENIGFALIPVLQDITQIVKTTILNFKQFSDEHPILTKQITLVVAAIGGLSLALGGILLTLPKMVSLIGTLTTSFQTLFTVISAHPIGALAIGLAAVTTAGLALANSYVSQKTAMVNTGKILEDRIKLLKTEKDRIQETLDVAFLSSKQREKLENDLLMRIKAIKYLEKDAEKQRIAEEQQMRAAAAEVALKKQKDLLAAKLAAEAEQANKERELAQQVANDVQSIREVEYQQFSSDLANKQMLKDTDAAYTSAMYAKDLEDYTLVLGQKLEALYFNTKQTKETEALAQKYKAELREIDKQQTLLAHQQVGASFNLMISDMKKEQIDWYKVFQDLRVANTTAFSTGFSEMFQGVGKGWDKLGSASKTILNGISKAFYDMSAQLLAKWTVDHISMAIQTKIWKTKEIIANSQVAASKAAAASAWSLFGAVAIGLAVGKAVEAMANAFATGTRGFSGGTALVGERGPELIQMPNGSNVLNAAETSNALAFGGRGNGSGGINIYNDFSNSSFMGTIDEITNVLSRKIYDNMRLQTNI